MVFILQNVSFYFLTRAFNCVNSAFYFKYKTFNFLLASATIFLNFSHLLRKKMTLGRFKWKTHSICSTYYKAFTELFSFSDFNRVITVFVDLVYLLSHDISFFLGSILSLNPTAVVQHETNNDIDVIKLAGRNWVTVLLQIEWQTQLSNTFFIYTILYN